MAIKREALAPDWVCESSTSTCCSSCCCWKSKAFGGERENGINNKRVEESGRCFFFSDCEGPCWCGGGGGGGPRVPSARASPKVRCLNDCETSCRRNSVLDSRHVTPRSLIGNYETPSSTLLTRSAFQNYSRAAPFNPSFFFSSSSSSPFSLSTIPWPCILFFRNHHHLLKQLRKVLPVVVPLENWFQQKKSKRREKKQWHGDAAFNSFSCFYLKTLSSNCVQPFSFDWTIQRKSAKKQTTLKWLTKVSAPLRYYYYLSTYYQTAIHHLDCGCLLLNIKLLLRGKRFAKNRQGRAHQSVWNCSRRDILII